MVKPIGSKLTKQKMKYEGRLKAELKAELRAELETTSFYLKTVTTHLLKRKIQDAVYAKMSSVVGKEVKSFPSFEALVIKFLDKTEEFNDLSSSDIEHLKKPMDRRIANKALHEDSEAEFSSAFNILQEMLHDKEVEREEYERYYIFAQS